MSLPPGLYEQLLTEALKSELSQLDPSRYRLAALDPGDSHSSLSHHLVGLVRSALRRLPADKRLDAQVQVCNRLLAWLAEQTDQEDLAHNQVTTNSEDTPAHQLLLVRPAEFSEGAQEWKDPERPDTPLSFGCILTGNTRVDPTLESQLRKEFATADHVDILCSFIKWSGIRTLREAIEQFTSRPDTRLRIITTSYIGATEVKAIEYLRNLPRTEVRISYDTKHTRLHAKAYLFQRRSGFSGAYVGSANLSHVAITEGLEWNVKISQRESSHLWEKLVGTFEGYWNDADFKLYTEADRENLQSALERERDGGAPEDAPVLFDLAPHPFQQEILDSIQAEREVLNRDRHLVVSATGTGKTMIAAFDYREWSRRLNRDGARPRILFIAHREEILRQAQVTFQQVLRDMNFGELLYGGREPASFDYLFATIQSYNSRELHRLPPEHFDYVVVDEFHHSAAASYQQLLSHLKPKSLLGLTATPERADLRNVFIYFGGSATAELRLPEAIGRKLLCPFHYFGVTDAVDLDTVRWTRGTYVEKDLDAVYTGNHVRAQLVRDKVSEILAHPTRARGLGFCVTVAHAAFMADFFTRSGLPSALLSGESPRQEREQVQNRLRRREINFIFTVDLYNEGVDIREVDTVLFLRPTESLTVFLQQLGRGLRHHPEKECLTVIDLVGRQNVMFRFDRQFRALMTDPTRNVAEEVKHGFSHLPPGCSIVLEKVARQHILDNIRQAVVSTRQALSREYADVRAALGRKPTYAEFLRGANIEPADLYRRDLTLARLAASFDGASPPPSPDELRLTKGLGRISHIDDPHWIRVLLSVMKMQRLDLQKLDTRHERYLTMAHLSLWHDQSSDLRELFTQLQANPALAIELSELLQWNLEHIRHISPIPALPFECPLALHSRYTRNEILAGLGYWTVADRQRVTEGVLHLKEQKADVCFVTLNKTAKDYSPTTMYEDYAISESLFHWQTQNATSEDSATGMRYRQHASRGQTILFFVRESKYGPLGAAPYYYLGPASYVSHTGSKPMSITWKLEHAMPAALLKVARRLVG